MRISEATWRLEDQRTTLRWNHPVEQQGLRTSSRHFQAALHKGRRRRVSTMGEKIKALLVEVQTREEWGTIKKW